MSKYRLVGINEKDAKELGVTPIKETWNILSVESATKLFNSNENFRKYCSSQYGAHNAKEYFEFMKSNLIKNNSNSPQLISINPDGSVNQHHFCYYYEINSLDDFNKLLRVLRYFYINEDSKEISLDLE